MSAPSYHFPFHSTIFVDLSTLNFRRPSLFSHLAIFPRRLSLCFHATIYKPGRICAQLALSAPRFYLRRSLYSLISANYSSSLHHLHLALFLVDSLFHYGILLSPLPSSIGHRYIKDISFSCAVGSSQEPPSPVHAFYWQSKSRYLRQQPQTTQMPLPSS